MFRARPIYSVISVLFHVGVILVPIFLLGHTRLWDKGIGVSWPALPRHVADVLTVPVIVTLVLLIVGIHLEHRPGFC